MVNIHKRKTCNEYIYYRSHTKIDYLTGNEKTTFSARDPGTKELHKCFDKWTATGETEALESMERGITIGEYQNLGLTLNEASDKYDSYKRSLEN
jgi:hypothetical protein